MQTLWQDLRYGARMLLKHKGLTAIAALSLALGNRGIVDIGGAPGLLYSGAARDEGRPATGP